MAIRRQSGFTLVEIIIVIAITGALMLMIFAGQRQLRDRASFDAAVERVVSSIATAHNESTAGLNLNGNGTGENDCAGTTSPVDKRFLFAGTAWAVRDSPTGAVFQINYYAVRADKSKLTRDLTTDACLFDTKELAIPEVLHIDPPGTNQTRRILFVRDDFGGVLLCNITNDVLNNSGLVTRNFQRGACVNPAQSGGRTIEVVDTAGHSSQIQIDSSGLARRLN